MRHVQWKYPDSEDDHRVHFLQDSEWTFCGMAYEGVDGNVAQGFKGVKKKVTCQQCIDKVMMAKSVKASEMDVLNKF